MDTENTELVLDILQIVYHPGYHIVRFRDSMHGATKVAVVFSRPGNCAILDPERLVEGNLQYSHHQDAYEAALRGHIGQWEEARRYHSAACGPQPKW